MHSTFLSICLHEYFKWFLHFKSGGKSFFFFFLFVRFRLPFLSVGFWLLCVCVTRNWTSFYRVLPVPTLFLLLYYWTFCFCSLFSSYLSEETIFLQSKWFPFSMFSSNVEFLLLIEDDFRLFVLCIFRAICYNKSLLLDCVLQQGSIKASIIQPRHRIP